jgi:uncharacterized protein with ParB-like and HNH nuclease domain
MVLQPARDWLESWPVQGRHPALPSRSRARNRYSFPAGMIEARLVIDGQQRLTPLQLSIAAARSYAAGPSDGILPRR